MYPPALSAPNPDHGNGYSYNPPSNDTNSHPHPVYNQTPIYNPPPAYNAENVYVGQHNYNPQPVYYAQPASQPLVYAQASQPRRLFRSNNTGVIMFACWTITEIIFIFIVFFTPWFGYCYWSFGLKYKNENVSSGKSDGDNKDSIANFYDDICPHNPYPECPNLCTSIKNVRYSGRIIYGFGSVCLVLSIISLVLVYAKLKKPAVKIPKILLLAMNCGSIVLYLIGFIAYYVSSKFSENFDKPKNNYYSIDNPNDFYWSAGLILSVILMAIQFFKLISSRVTIGYLYI